MQHLVAGVNGSLAAARALHWAAAEAKLWDALLTIVHCYPVDPEHGTSTRESWQTATRTVDEITWRARDHLDGVRWQARTSWAPSGSWAYKLAEASQDADLLVVGSRGLGGLMELLLGSVSQHVSRRAATSVVVVRGDGDVNGYSGDVVVGVDGSPSSLHALRWGASEAERRGTYVQAIHAYTVRRGLVGAARGLGAGSATPAEDEARSMAIDLVASTVERAALPSNVTVQQTVVHGSPVDVLTRAVHHDQLLVCGASGRGTVGQIMLGSVSRQCIRHARAPVVVARPQLTRATGPPRTPAESTFL